MKSIVNNNTKINKIKPFPKLMILPATGTIILATSYYNDGNNNRPYGIIVSEGKTTFPLPVGQIAEWSKEFVDFEGSVTLSNDRECDEIVSE